MWYDTKNHGLKDRMLSWDCGVVICSLICDALNFVLMKLLQFCLKLWLLTREFCLLSYYMSLSFPDSAWLFICTLFPVCCDWFTPLALLIMLHLCLNFMHWIPLHEQEMGSNKIFQFFLWIKIIVTVKLMDVLTCILMFSLVTVDIPPWFSAVSISLNSDVDLVSNIYISL